MRHAQHSLAALVGLFASLAVVGCSSPPEAPLYIGFDSGTTTGATSGPGATSTGTPGATTGGNPTGAGGSATGAGGGTSAADEATLDARVVDYGEALRTASLKLVGALPPLSHVKTLASSDDPKTQYEAYVDEMIADTRFEGRMIKWWKDIFRMGDDEGAMPGFPSRETAPTFAAEVIVQGRPYTDIFTASDNTCPTYDSNANVFQDGACSNGVDTPSGVLTDPGVQWQFFGHMAFRRVRWVQEIFVCTKMPAEFAATPSEINGAEYTSPWDFASVSTTPINFQDTSSVVCANCHTTINHIAPLFANFDDHGQFKSSIQVQTPTAPDPTTTQMSDWLAAGETTHWRHGEAVADIPALGQAMAADQDVADCAVTRAYNFAFSKGDAVTDLAFPIPAEIIDVYRTQFQQNGGNLKESLRSMFKSDDFVKF